MLEELNNLDAIFVTWFVPRDYDALYDWITEEVGEVEFFKKWRDSGAIPAFWMARGWYVLL